jgi:hypothetical protein
MSLFKDGSPSCRHHWTLACFIAEVAANDALEEGALNEHPVNKRAVVVAMARTLGYMGQVGLFFNKDAGYVDHHVDVI